MTYKSDSEIAQAATLKPIMEIAEKAGFPAEAVIPYGRDKAKLDINQLRISSDTAKGKLILVTAITPTPAGEGKTTTSIGLADGLTSLNYSAMLALREPSLGPVFGMKGGATGGGYAQVLPMEEINLHFNGDFHAIGAASNLLAALIDNHIHHGNKLRIDPRQIVWKRAVDMNDRQLRYIVSGLHGKANGSPREDGFEITVASEVMAIFCLANSLQDLKEKLSHIIVAYNYDGEPVTAGQLEAAGAMTAILKEAFNPNLVQTLEHTPALIHGGPFANIAHGCNSVLATKLALNYADYVVTEAGFGADLGAEKFIDIKCRQAGIAPDAVVLVATIRALKMHGGVAKDQLPTENVAAVEAGLSNLMRHLDVVQNVYHLPAVVAINKFPTDTDAELDVITKACEAVGANVVLSDVWANGGKGGQDLACAVLKAMEEPKEFHYTYDVNVSLKDKLNAIVQRVYGGVDVELTAEAKRDLRRLEKLGYDKLPICMAKTQYSFSDDKKLLGAPSGFTVTIRQLKVSAGAGFVVALTGDIMTMPGLPKVPAANNIDVDENGQIQGLF